MITELKPHESYEATRLPWVEQAPSHWKLVPNRAYLRRRKVLVGKYHKNFQLLSLTKQGVIVRDLSKQKGKFSSDMGTSQEVRRGDLVFCLFDVPETPRTVGLSKHSGMITGAYCVFECRDARAATFLERFYIAMDDRKLLSPLYTGLRHTIPAPVFLGTKTPFPPPEEQELIVRFLDWANTRLGKAIAAKRKVIKLLEEQKQAIIHRAVTRGLEDSVHVKHSNIDWLGDVPEHWQVKRIKYLMKVVDNRSESGDEVLLSMRKYHGLVAYHEHFSKPPQAATLKGFKIIEKGQIATNRMQAGFGLIFESSMRGIVSPDFGVFQPTGEVVPEFLGLVFRSRIVRAKFHRESKGLGTGKSGFMRLYDDRIGWIHIAYPPTVEEQRNILHKLAVELEEIGKPREIVEREIGLLQEYRARLIADVVTGKLDVRAFARTLPADIAEEAAELADSELDEEELFEADEELVEEPA